MNHVNKKNMMMIIFTSISILVFLVLSAFAYSGGVRGSDQYRYISDTESLIKGESYSNIIFPAVFKNGVVKSMPRPFVHNVPVVYVAAFIGMFTVPYAGWAVLNILLTLSTAFLIFLILKKRISIEISVLFSLLYIALPMVFWSGTQVLSESFIAFFTTLGIYLFLNYKENLLNWYFMMIISIVLLYCRTNFIIAVFMIPVLYLFVMRKKAKISIIVMNMVVMFIIAVFALKFKKVIFPSYSTGSSLIHTIFYNALPGKSNMANFNSLYLPQISINTMLQNITLKLIQAIKIQFSFNLKTALMYLPFNIMALGSVAGLLISGKKSSKIMLTGVFFLLYHMATVVLFQNQTRYGMMAISGIFVAFAVFVCTNQKIHISNRVIAIILIVALPVCFASDFILARQSRNEGIVSAKSGEVLKDAFRYIPDHENISIYSDDLCYLEAYVARPRMVLLVGSNYSESEYEYMFGNSDIQWLIADNMLDLGKLPEFHLSNVYTYSKEGKDYTVYKINHET